MNIEDCHHYIVHKDSDKVIGEYKNQAEAYAAYEKLGYHMSDHAIGVVEVYDKEKRTYVPKKGESK
jgi:hypothetical protein